MEREFGIRLKNLRKFKKITQEKLAEMIDMDIRQIARLEAGESLPSVPTLLKLCTVFNVTPNDLIYTHIDNETNGTNNKLKSDIHDILSLAKDEQLELIKKLILAVL